MVRDRIRTHDLRYGLVNIITTTWLDDLKNNPNKSKFKKLQTSLILIISIKMSPGSLTSLTACNLCSPSVNFVVWQIRLRQCALSRLFNGLPPSEDFLCGELVHDLEYDCLLLLYGNVKLYVNSTVACLLTKTWYIQDAYFFFNLPPTGERDNL